MPCFCTLDELLSLIAPARDRPRILVGTTLDPEDIQLPCLASFAFSMAVLIVLFVGVAVSGRPEHTERAASGSHQVGWGERLLSHRKQPPCPIPVLCLH